MKPTVTIIYNVVLAITSVLLLYSYFYVLVYDKDFFKEDSVPNEMIHTTADKKKLDSLTKDSSVPDTVPSISDAESMDSFKTDSFSTAAVKTTLPTAAPDKQPNDEVSEQTFKKESEHVNFLDMLVVMFLAGLLGGVLANLRGIFEFYREEKGFPDHLFIPYLIRPLTAAISGLLVFFISHLIISSTANPTYNNEYISFRGMVSFMSLAIISGFASQEFTERLKAAAGTLFGISPTDTLEHLEGVTPSKLSETNPEDLNNLNSDPTTNTNPDTPTTTAVSESTTPEATIPTPSAPQSSQKKGKSRYRNRD